MMFLVLRLLLLVLNWFKISNYGVMGFLRLNLLNRMYYVFCCFEYYKVVFEDCEDNS